MFNTGFALGVNTENVTDMSTNGDKEGLTYAGAGVDIEAGNRLVDMIKPLAAATARPGADAALGGFGGLFDISAAGFRDPLLVAATDGVGTKVLVAIQAGLHANIGVDLVAMCVNDLIVQGAEPLFFLDYFATGKLKPEAALEVIAGIARGCRQAGCALIGGETAEMPGMYAEDHYDLAGFAVGAVERGAALPRLDAMKPGDVLVGLASSGPHSNGYSLIRKIVEKAGLGWDDEAPFARKQTLGEMMLQPTRIYVEPILGALRLPDITIKGLAHITGGGLPENLPRVLPEHLAAEVNLSQVPMFPLFKWLQKAGGISDEEMLRTFNCGVGMVVILDPDSVETFIGMMAARGEWPVVIGRLAERGDDGAAVRFTGKLGDFK